MKKCFRCGFTNPEDIDECLYCHRKLEKSVAEAQEGLKFLKNLSDKNWMGAGTQLFQGSLNKSTAKARYAYDPIWQLKLKMFRMKKKAISFFWFLVVMAVLILIVFMMAKLGKK